VTENGYLQHQPVKKKAVSIDAYLHLQDSSSDESESSESEEEEESGEENGKNDPEDSEKGTSGSTGAECTTKEAVEEQESPMSDRSTTLSVRGKSNNATEEEEGWNSDTDESSVGSGLYVLPPPQSMKRQGGATVAEENGLYLNASSPVDERVGGHTPSLSENTQKQAKQKKSKGKKLALGKKENDSSTMSTDPNKKSIMKKKKKKTHRKKGSTLANSQNLDEWNHRFQRCLERMHKLSEGCAMREKMVANTELMHLSEDFVHASRTVGKIIISEVYLPLSKKTIKPQTLGGRAGGEKYIVHNILFKFAVDSSNLFDGSNWAAAKVDY
tara:strand:- start:88 stop:1071 length:984 start_codon:yes stop_codon:yes gene_type:complete